MKQVMIVEDQKMIRSMLESYIERNRAIRSLFRLLGQIRRRASATPWASI